MKQVLGNEELYLELLKDYCQISHRKELTDKYEEGDYSTYRVYVHALKSNSRIVGFLKLGDMAEAQEMALKSQDMEYVHKNHMPLMEAYEKAVSSCYN